MPRSFLLATALLSLGALGACDDERKVRIAKDQEPATALRAASQLECPEAQGPLTRVRTTPDGLSCVYAGPKGAEVTLRLVKLESGSGESVLEALEQELNGLLPSVAAKIAGGRTEAAEARALAEAQQSEAEGLRADADRAAAEAERAQALAEKARALADGDSAGAEAAQARADEIAARLATASESAESGRENVQVALPGLRVKTEGDDTSVRLPGIRIETKGDKADVRIGPMTIRADDSSGSVDINASDTEMTVRSHDEASEIRTRRKGTGVRATYILVDEQASPQGWRLVGYEARGPSDGPLVVAVVKAKDRREDDIFDAAKDLVRRNAGG